MLAPVPMPKIADPIKGIDEAIIICTILFPKKLIAVSCCVGTEELNKNRPICLQMLLDALTQL